MHIWVASALPPWLGLTSGVGLVTPTHPHSPVLPAHVAALTASVKTKCWPPGTVL